MRDFLTFARDNDVLPDKVVWHELGLPEGNVSEDPKPWFIADHVADYRALEKSLGIGPLPISINEFAVQREEGVPGGNIRYFAQLERTGVETACAAFWFRPGRLSNILTDQAKANGGWWLYRWYGEMAGKMAMATSSRPRALSLEGIASVDAATKTAHVLFGGTDGEATVSLLGFGAAGFTSSQVHVKAEAAPYLGADTEVPEPLVLFEGDFWLAGDRLVLPFRGLDASWGYHLVLTASGAARTRYEAEGAALTSAAVVRDSAASSDALVGPMSAADSAATFTVQAPRAGAYRLEVRYANGSSGVAKQRLSINGVSAGDVDLPPTSGWLEQGKAGVVEVPVTLQAGGNTLTLSRGSGAGVAELDHVQLSPVGAFRRRVGRPVRGLHRRRRVPRALGGRRARGGRVHAGAGLLQRRWDRHSDADGQPGKPGEPLLPWHGRLGRRGAQLRHAQAQDIVGDTAAGDQHAALRRGRRGERGAGLHRGPLTSTTGVLVFAGPGQGLARRVAPVVLIRAVDGRCSRSQRCRPAHGLPVYQFVQDKCARIRDYQAERGPSSFLNGAERRRPPGRS